MYRCYGLIATDLYVSLLPLTALGALFDMYWALACDRLGRVVSATPHGSKRAAEKACMFARHTFGLCCSQFYDFDAPRAELLE